MIFFVPFSVIACDIVRTPFTPGLQIQGFRGGLEVKNLPASVGAAESRSLEDPLGKGMATHSSILACNIPWTEEPGGL